jgi:ABC-2 type transport system permease protein
MVTLKVETNKFYADSIGNLTDAPLNDYIYIGITGEKDKELYLKKHKLINRETEITIIVDEKPKKVGIDPYLILIDRNRDDNVMNINKVL